MQEKGTVEVKWIDVACADPLSCTVQPLTRLATRCRREGRPSTINTQQQQQAQHGHDNKGHGSGWREGRQATQEEKEEQRRNGEGGEEGVGKNK
jgi:hypothetical protein